MVGANLRCSNLKGEASCLCHQVSLDLERCPTCKRHMSQVGNLIVNLGQSMDDLSQYIAALGSGSNHKKYLMVPVCLRRFWWFEMRRPRPQ